MVQSRLPLIALLGSVGCTQQGTPSDGPPPPEPIPRGDAQGPGATVRAVSAEERQKLFPTPPPEAPMEQAAAPEPTPDQALPPAAAQDYAEQRRRAYRTTYFSGKGSGIEPAQTIQLIQHAPKGVKDAPARREKP